MRKQPNGLLQFDYFLNVFKLVIKYSRKKGQDKKKEMLAKRRALLKEGKDSEYADSVKESM